jgi:hypothetical protein
MTQDETIELARKAGFRVGPSRDGPDDVWGVGANLKRLAELIAEKEREECAKIIDDSYETTTPSQGIPEDWLLTLSEAIRARGQE